MSHVKQHLVQYLISLGDNPLILGQRLGEWCGHGPILEVDMALTNISLDLLGQTRSYFQYAAELEGEGRTEDDIAFLRQLREYKNVLLVEQPNQDFAYTIARQFFFDVFHYLFLQELQASNDEQLAAIAAKSIKEVKYHLRFSKDWMLRLGDGTEESHNKLQHAVNDLWIYVEELYTPSPLDQEMAELGIGVELGNLATPIQEHIRATLSEATILIPKKNWPQSGGKMGNHTEHLGYILAEMQYLQRTYPGAKW
ncbi:MAG: 1,2-phenylacetyl-CoA epoxidase subunit PaaC [Bacteroidota bacterium]